MSTTTLQVSDRARAKLSWTVLGLTVAALIVTDLEDDLLTVVTETVNPTHVSMWLRPTEEQP